ncbi:zinc ribbon domain-containing protein, partial [Escherichia coli]|uniref:zinc ribbon domain-containing protein n=1 Tax=Escherichia coli TaxID=562 RepID=UPI0035D50B37
VLAVPPAYTSQRCACCGHTAKENRLSQSKFRCQVCGYTANADVNGARNILAAGHGGFAFGAQVQSGASVEEEPVLSTPLRSHGSPDTPVSRLVPLKKKKK